MLPLPETVVSPVPRFITLMARDPTVSPRLPTSSVALFTMLMEPVAPLLSLT
ncbi:hypothetical protein D3C78_1943710 [compost metagenome]